MSFASQRKAILFSVGMVFVLAPLARADIDPSGAWQIQVVDPLFGPVQLGVNFQRSGTSLIAYRYPTGPSPIRGPVQLVGSIDPVAGTFSVSGPSCGSPFGSQNDGSIVGTFDLTGGSFTGTIVAGVVGSPLRCLHVSGNASGARTAATCGNGTVEPGETCDAGHPTDGCCSATCETVGAGVVCTIWDSICELGLFGVCPTCSIGHCDQTGSCLQTLRSAGSLCRAAGGECDVAETCDGASPACPSDQVVPPPDTDGDGLNDGCDPCTGGTSVEQARLKVTRLTPPSLLDSLSLRGTVAVADLTMIDPVQQGMRLLIEDETGVRYVDATAPSGSLGWKVTSNGWSFHGNGAIGSAKLKRSAASLTTLTFAVRGKGAVNGAPPEANLPVKATVVFDAPHANTGLCGEATFPGPPGAAPSCALRGGGSSLLCR